MTMFYLFGNDASALKKTVPDINIRGFLTKITKKVYYQNVSYLQSLIGSSTKLISLNPHRKEKFFLSSSSRFFFFNNASTNSERIEKELQKALLEKVHFKFAEAAAGQITKLALNLLKNPTQSDRDEYYVQQVLSSSGVLLELTCKICVSIVSPSVFHSYTQPNLSKKSAVSNTSRGWFYFVGVFFGTTIISFPPIIQRLQNSTKATDAYKIVEKQLMKFINVDTPIEYSVVFSKFNLLFLRNYDQYKFKYLANNLSKEGFFDSIGGFFSKAASVVSNVVGTATSVYSTAMDVYQNTIKPIAQTLTPVLSPFLPGSVGSVLRMVAENSTFIEDGKINPVQYQSLTKIIRSKEKIDQILNQADILKNLVVVKLLLSSETIQYYTGVLLSEDIILSEVPEKGQENRQNLEVTQLSASFYSISQGKLLPFRHQITISLLTKYMGNMYFFRLEQKVKDFKPLFELDFKKDHISNTAFHEYLVNKDVFMASFRKQKNQATRSYQQQVSKILKSTDTHFLDGFAKYQGCMGSPIFYIDKKTNKYKIIGTCSQDNPEIDILAILQKNLSGEDIDKAKSTFLIESTFRNDFIKAKSGNNENSPFDVINKKLDTLVVVNSKQQGNFESLRGQLEAERVTKHSFLHHIGIVRTEGQSQTKYGVGVFISKNQLLTLRKYVANDGNGSVYVRKDNTGSDISFDILEPDHFQKYPIQSITRNDSDFVKIEIKRDKGPALQLNYIQKEALSITELIGGFYLEFNFSADSNGLIKEVPTKWSHLTTNQMEKQQIGFSSISSSSQRLYFAYRKGGFISEQYKNEYIFGISNPDASNKINYLYEESFFIKKKSNNPDKDNGQQENATFQQQKIIFPDKRTALIQEQQLRPYEPVGIILHTQEKKYPGQFSGTGTLIEVTIKRGNASYTLKDLYMITCGHNFIFLNSDNLYDLSGIENMEAYVFQYGRTKLIENLYDFRQRFTNYSEPNVCRNFAQVVTPVQYKENLQKRDGNSETTFDIAIVKLSSQPRTRPTAYKLLLDNPQSQGDLKSLITNNISDIRLTGYPGSQAKWGSKLGIMFTQSVADHSSSISEKEKSQFVEVFDRKLKHKLSSLGGNSGSAIVLKDRVIGIHTTGVPKRNSEYGLYNLATSVYDKDIYDWLNQFFQKEANAESS